MWNTTTAIVTGLMLAVLTGVPAAAQTVDVGGGIAVGQMAVCCDYGLVADAAVTVRRLPDMSVAIVADFGLLGSWGGTVVPRLRVEAVVRLGKR